MTCFYLPWIFNTTPAIDPKIIQPSIHVSPNSFHWYHSFPIKINQTANRI